MLPNKANFLLKLATFYKNTTKDVCSMFTALFTQHNFTVQINFVAWMSYKHVLISCYYYYCSCYLSL